MPYTPKLLSIIIRYYNLKWLLRSCTSELLSGGVACIYHVYWGNNSQESFFMLHSSVISCDKHLALGIA